MGRRRPDLDAAAILAASGMIGVGSLPGFPRGLSGLHATVGNRAIVSLLRLGVAPLPVQPDRGRRTRVVRTRRPPRPPWVIPDTIATAAELGPVLLAGGVRENRLGDLEAAFALPRRQQLLGDLATRMGQLIIPGWNRGVDDLTSDHYPSILHYLDELDRLSAITTGVDRYVEAVRQMPTVQIAGIETQVNPRALYFAAAGQVAMDEEANRRLAAGAPRFGEGRGHYMATPALVAETQRIGRDAAAFVRERIRGRGRRQVRNPEGASGLLAALGSRLTAVYEQVAGETTQLEPKLKRWLETARPTLAQFMGQAPAGDDDALNGIAALAAVIGKGPKVSILAHGYGSVGDRHSTMHAMGLAVDLFNSRTGEPTNLSKRSSKYLPFVWYVIARYGGGNWPADPADLTNLLAEHADEAVEACAEGVTREQRAAIVGYRRTLIRDIGGPLRRVKAAVDRIRLRHAPQAIRDDARQATSHAQVKLAEAIALLPRDYNAAVRAPATIQAGVEAARDAVDALLATPAGRWRAPLDRARDAARLGDLPGRLEGVDPGIALEERRTKAAAVIRPRRAFDRWLASVRTLEGAMHDQPAEVSRGLGSVRGTSFQGWHHWQVGDLVHLDLARYGHGAQYKRPPRANVVTGYGDALREDMRPRPKDQMERILTTMAETPPGRRALWGSWQGQGDPPDGRDADLRAALRDWAMARPRDEGADVTEVLRRAQAATAAADNAGAGSLVDRLMRQGHRTLATSLANGSR